MTFYQNHKIIQFSRSGTALPKHFFRIAGALGILGTSTHWDQDKMDTNLLTFSIKFCWQKIVGFWFKLHWNWFPRCQLTIIWSFYLDQCRPSLLMDIWVTWPWWVNLLITRNCWMHHHVFVKNYHNCDCWCSGTDSKNNLITIHSHLILRVWSADHIPQKIKKENTKTTQAKQFIANWIMI